MNPNNITNCSNAKEFIDILDPSSEFWTVGTGKWRLDMIFRGQAEAPGRRLIPKAFRQQDEFARSDMTFARKRAEQRAVVEMTFLRSQQELVELYGIDNVRAWFIQIYAEITNMRDYIGFAKTLNFNVSWPLLSDLPVFGTRFAELYSSELNNQAYMLELWGLPAFAVAQHHGLSTRLLDWTRNPLFAAFFAVHDLPEAATEIAVYAIHSHLPSARFRVIEVDRSISPYIAAQDGLFILDTLADQDFLQTGKWRSLDEEYANDLHKVTLPISEVGELMRLLWLKQVTIAHMMPVIDNILSALLNKWRWQYPDTSF